MKPRFTIANLLLFTAIIGLMVGWWMDHRQISKKYQAKCVILSQVISKSTSIDRYRMLVLDWLKDKAENQYRALTIYDQQELKTTLDTLRHKSEEQLTTLNSIEVE